MNHWRELQHLQSDEKHEKSIFDLPIDAPKISSLQHQNVFLSEIGY